MHSPKIVNEYLLPILMSNFLIYETKIRDEIYKLKEQWISIVFL